MFLGIFWYLGALVLVVIIALQGNKISRLYHERDAALEAVELANSADNSQTQAVDLAGYVTVAEHEQQMHSADVTIEQLHIELGEEKNHSTTLNNQLEAANLRVVELELQVVRLTKKIPKAAKKGSRKVN